MTTTFLKSEPDEKTTARDFIPAAALFVIGTLFVGALSMRPVAGQPILAAVFPPTHRAEEGIAAVSRAGGLILREGFARNILIVRSDGSSDFAERLQAKGALFVLDPVSAFGCLRPWTAPSPS
jgi:hypothetical protein